MTLKIRISKSLTRLFIILAGLAMIWFSEKILVSNIYKHGLMPNLIKKSWAVPNIYFREIFIFCSFALDKHLLYCEIYCYLFPTNTKSRTQATIQEDAYLLSIYRWGLFLVFSCVSLVSFLLKILDLAGTGPTF